ncbi:uncharacterized protein LOC127837574 [Dreissena polymorpha]|uniref:YqaJ viral recombinase domain-containing protein n=1 Tax=Dreissena polymorpha TaxID=45954 RepID=A0A9D4FNJ9_DREPO|nr:uncharacterized protein LOC127837574 [Dreissena polymorpha]KAH3800458.1 hypothetical protein DPMN_154091 [Dreissena polymorpha]
MLNSKEIESQSCACSAGKGSCAHVAALVYQVAHYKTLHKTTVPELVSKTSCPQSFHIPSKVDGIKPRPVNEVSFVKPNPKKSLHEQSESCICSTLYNPVNTSYPDNSFVDGIQTLLPLCDDTLQIFKILPQTSNPPPVKTTAYGTVYIGSTLAHQLPEPKADGSIFRIPDGPEFPKLPVHDRYVQPVYATVLTENESLFMDSMQVSESESVEIERETRSQSLNPLWNRLRQKRLTASIFKDVVSRQKDFESLVERLTSGRKIQTAAMKHGLEHECEAALEYSTHKQVNVRPCGFVINPAAPFIGASPDRIVYDPSESDPFGLLEIKCPLKESYKEAPCLKGNSDGTFSLRESNSYYMQVMGQMAVTGLPWCDLCVWTENDMHIERIYFNDKLWSDMFSKLSIFYHQHLIKKFV